MKKAFSTIFCLVFGITLIAQEKMYLYKTDNSILEFLLEEIDNLSFSDDYLNLYIYNTDNNTTDILVSQIDSITFVEPFDATAVYINYSGNTAYITNPYEGNGITITQKGADITVNSTLTDNEVRYILSGTAQNASFKLYSEYKFELVLRGLDITSADGPAINIQCGKKVTVTLEGGTENYLTDSSTYNEPEDEDMKAAFFSEGQLVFEGNGTLYVQGNCKHGICSDDYIRINSGNIIVTGAEKDGIHVNDYFRMDGGNVEVKASGDGIECEKGYIIVNSGYITIKAVEDGLKASYKNDPENAYIEFNGGVMNITSTGGEKATAIKGRGDIIINNGEFILATHALAGKGINASGDLKILNGVFDITTTGNAFYDTSDKDTSSCSAMKCDGDMHIENAVITINSSGTGGKGINVGGALVIESGDINVTTTGNQFVDRQNNADTAAKAIKSTGNLTVNGGTVIIRTTKTEAEGLESKDTLTINNGWLEIEAYDDCINASNHIEINGGYVYCNSTSNDGIDSNGTLTITGGVIVSAGAGIPEDGIDCDNNTFKITGGTIIGIGGSTSTPTSSVCTQRSVIYSTSTSNIQIIHIESSDGKEVLTFKSPKTYSRTMTLMFSSPELEGNNTYTIYTGGSISGGTDFHGLYEDAVYTGGTSTGNFTTNNMVTTIGTTGGGPGGRP